MISNQTILSLLEERCKILAQLKQLHALMIITSLTTTVVPLSRLIDRSIDLGDLAYADSLFRRTARPSLFIWNSMLRALAAGTDPAAALPLYRDLQRAGLAPDNFTLPSAARACAAVPDARFGRCVHARALKTGYEADVYVSATLLHMYVSCGCLRSARTLFDEAPNRNVVGWTTMIAGYVGDGRAEEAIQLFREMELAAVPPSEITMVHLLTACARARDLETGRRAHAQLGRMGAGSVPRNVVLATALMDMYARCGSLSTAREVFDAMPERNEVAWNAMISAYHQYGRCDEALELFGEMRGSGLKPDEVTLLSLLGVCGAKGDDIVLGQGIHAYIEKTYSCCDVAIGTSLMGMYAKTGDTQSALKVFDGLERKDVLAWTSMIIGLATHGHGQEAVILFRDMERDGIVPDGITFMGVLTACSHAGMIEEGRRHFNSMSSVYGIMPDVEHYGCLVDLLSRAGHLVEAERVLRSMPVRPNVVVWGAVLNGCEIHGEIALANRLAYRLSDVDRLGSGVHVLLSNIYAGAGRWEGVERARQLMKRRRIEKNHGTSSIGVLSSSLVSAT